MADLHAKIIPLQSEVPGRVPTDAQVDVGEIAINLEDRKIFSKKSDGTVVTLGVGGDQVVNTVNGMDGDVSLGIQDTTDFALNQAPPPGSYEFTDYADGAFRIPDNDHEWAVYSGSLRLWNTAADGTDLTDFFGALPASDGTVWWSNDGLSFTQATYSSKEIRNDGEALEHIRLHGLNPMPTTLSGSLFVQFAQPGAPVDVPLSEGDILQWNTTDQKFTPAQLAAVATSGSYNDLTDVPSLAVTSVAGKTGDVDLGIHDLTDVNTVSVAPQDGDALVWSDLGQRWQPGQVASSTPDTALDDLTDVTVATPSTGQLLRYDGASWVNATLDYTDLQNKPTIPSSTGDLSDVDLSLAPKVGQILVWNGSAWAPEDPASGGGGGTIAGALVERADETLSTSAIGDGVTAQLSFVALGNAGQFVQVTASQPAWVRFYATASDRSSDAARPIGEDPQPGSGVLLEVITDTPGQVVKVTPGAIYYNNDTPGAEVLYCSVRNLSGSEAIVSVTVRAYTQTAIDSPSFFTGGTYGSG